MKRSLSLKKLLVDGLLLCCITLALIWPLFHLEYLDNWSSIESTFISDARILSTHLPHQGWQHLWYCGTRFDYIYPPALRYGTAVFSRLAHISTARSYHLYTGFFYVLGIFAVYWLVLTGTASRVAGWTAALATALLSPSFLLLPLIRADSGFRVPQRLHVLMSYGEGPHISALCVLPAALAASLLALRKWNPGMVAVAGALCALVVANNFYGATALAMFFPLLVWAVWTGERKPQVWWRAAGIVAIAYGLSAYWLTPSFIHITLLDLQWVSQPGNTSSAILETALIAVYCAISWWFGRPGREWTFFVAGSAALFSLNVLGYYYWGFHVSGEGFRLVPELDLVLILGCTEVARTLWKHPLWHIPVALAVLAAFTPAWKYLNHAWSPFPQAKSLDSQYEYRVAKWIHDNRPGDRVLATGTVRFWYDSWFDNVQPDGGSMQGMLNQILPVANWQIVHGSEPELAILWMQALGTDAAIVPDKRSPEPYQDFQHPAKFRNAIPAIYDDGRGTVVYAVPRVHPGIGRIVEKQALGSIGKVRGGDDVDTLSKYVAAVENPEQPIATVTWPGPDEADVRAVVSPGQSLLLQETWDSAWHAYEGGAEMAIRPEPVMNFMLIDLPAGSHAIRMRFETPFENRAGEVLFVITILAIGALVFFSRKRASAVRI